jgi:hypothetical protein
MKILKYNLCTIVNHGTEEEPKIEEILSPVEMGWNEANEEIAKKEAYNGEYTIEDDGQPEPEAQQTPEERIAELEEALDMLLNGVTE